jgi:hypothetical protein
MVSLMGFWMMLHTADHVYLLTKERSGMTVVFEKGSEQPAPAWLRGKSAQARCRARCRATHKSCLAG